MEKPEIKKLFQEKEKSDLKQILKKYFGYDQFRFRQQEIIELLLAGKNVLAIMPTGSGKSLLYQLPSLILPDLTIVISPLIALMKDQVDGLVLKDIDAAFINSSLSKTDREQRYRVLKEGGYKILYVAPERFRKPDFVDIIRKRKISLFAVDEAHCISQWGHDFRPDYSRLSEFRKVVDNPLTIAMTATATPDVQKDILMQLNLKEEQTVVFHTGIERKNLYLEVHEVWGEDEKFKQIVNTLKQVPGNGIIYFSLIKDLMKMSERFDKAKIRHLIYHGELESRQRKKIQDRFIHGKNQLVLATNAFGMGVDKENIRFVIHAQLPGSLEAYYQEIGRAGRDGKTSICSLLYDQQDLNIHMEFIKWNNPTADFYDRAYRQLLADSDRVNAEGIDFLKEQLTYKNRFDYRLETVLNLFDRWAVTEGEIEKRNLKVISELPQQLTDQTYFDMKLKNEQQKLYQMMQYIKTKECRKAFIHNYFGLGQRERCMACDNDTKL
ncbi:MAG: ATP-dependent DNA helicase RecQ [Calditrichaceae bacterium]|nr:ATP-dependent DNA helicase RecQ [Calditrichaceae bacterium]MBN2710466.1 ATP-dependent DNA helicase RecQ [Calditrichaceae bacterium]RQV93642.1 MAG: ATP-dependent DNA helicase RecQ [Calditrichota bacterium]